MKAFIVDRYGRADSLRAGEMPEPELREDDVLVQVHAAGVNMLDNKIRAGEFKLILPFRLPLILGNDVAGVVVRVGSRVRHFKVGDEVYARPHHNRIGTFAEFIAMNEEDVAPKPKSLTHGASGVDPLVGLTAWQALIERAGLKKGHRRSHPCRLRRRWNIRHPAGQTFRAKRPWQRRRVQRISIWCDGSVPMSSSTHKKDDFAKVIERLRCCARHQSRAVLEKSLQVLEARGKVIGIAGPPDPEFAKFIGSNRLMGLMMRSAEPQDQEAGEDAAMSAIRSCSCGPAEASCARSPPSSMPGSSARS